MKRFPPRKEIESVLKEIEADPGSSVLPPNASAKVRLKFQLCEAIVIYFKRKRLTQRQLAEQLKVDEAKVSEVQHYRRGVHH